MAIKLFFVKKIAVQVQKRGHCWPRECQLCIGVQLCAHFREKARFSFSELLRFATSSASRTFPQSPHSPACHIRRCQPPIHRVTCAHHGRAARRTSSPVHVCCGVLLMRLRTSARSLAACVGPARMLCAPSMGACPVHLPCAPALCTSPAKPTASPYLLIRASAVLVDHVHSQHVFD